MRHPPHDEALQAFDEVCWALQKGPDEDLYECARNVILSFRPFDSFEAAMDPATKSWPHLDAALAIVVTTAEPWDAIIRAAAILREHR